ncbi:hypothetical protein BA893_05070 [Vibrio natriegens]|nr:hypothetical protein BA893_05070 [Vibrio natriegens]
MIHGNKGRIPVNKTSESPKKEVQSPTQTKYYDVNLQHLAEFLVKNAGIDVKWEILCTRTNAIHHVQSFKQRRSRVRKYRERMESLGLMYQMIGSLHQWFGD